MAKVGTVCPNPDCRNSVPAAEPLAGQWLCCPRCGTTVPEFPTPATPPTETFPLPAPAPTSNAALPLPRPVGEDGIFVHWEPGDTILDLYEVREIAPGKPFAEGGMGRVNLVRHRDWNVDLAVKSVNPEELGAGPGAVAAFEREAEDWVNKVGLHPHVVGCRYARVLGGVPRVFVEYVGGGSLAEWIGTWGDGRLYAGTPEEALARILDVGIQFAWGLHYVHGLGMVHQDVKPGNVMMTEDGIAKVTDFGLANAQAIAYDEEPAAKSTHATYRGRTAEYCSPEQAEVAAKRAAGVPRERCRRLTLHTDMWSWAVSVLEMFLGGRRWTAGNIAGGCIGRLPVNDQPPKMPNAVADLLRRCMQEEPEARPPDMGRVAEDLLEVYQGVTGLSYPREMPRANETLADTLNNRGVSLHDLGRHDEAAKAWDDALHVDPHHPEAIYNRGSCYGGRRG